MGRLVVGTSSQEARDVQRALNMARRRGGKKLKEDGVVTEELLEAIRNFQKHCGLQRNGQPDGRTMKALAAEASSEPMDLQITLHGRIYLLSKRDYQQLVSRTIRALRFKGPAGQIASKVARIRTEWDHHHNNNRRSPVVSWLIEATRGVDLPPESVVKNAERVAAQVEAALQSRDLKAAHNAIGRAEPIVNLARRQLLNYRKEVVQGGQNWITALEVTRTAAFVTVGILAVPVAASFGAGAIASGVIAGAGTAAVESLSNEVGKGIAGSSEGAGTAATNVLRDTVIGGAIGALTRGKFAEKIVEGVGAQIARRATASWMRQVSQRTAVRYIGVLLKGSLSSALEGAISDALGQLRSNPEMMTWDKFMTNIALNLVSGGLFAKLDGVLDPRARSLVANMPANTRRELLRGMGSNISNRDLEQLFSGAGSAAIQKAYGAAVDQVLSRAKGTESPQVIRQKVLEKTFDKKLIARLVDLQKVKQRMR